MMNKPASYQMYHLICFFSPVMECAVQQAIWKSNCIFLPSLLQPFHLNLSSNKATAAAADQLVRSILLYNKAVDMRNFHQQHFQQLSN